MPACVMLPPHETFGTGLRTASENSRFGWPTRPVALRFTADCSLDEALGLMRERAVVMCHTVDEVAEAVCRHDVWFN